MQLSQEQKDIITLMVKLGIYGTLISIPIGLWAIPRWRDQPIIPAAILTAVGFALKEVMISHGENSEPIYSELAGAAIGLNPRRRY